MSLLVTSILILCGVVCALCITAVVVAACIYIVAGMLGLLDK